MPSTLRRETVQTDGTAASPINSDTISFPIMNQFRTKYFSTRLTAIALAICSLPGIPVAADIADFSVTPRDVRVGRDGSRMKVAFNLSLDSLELPSGRQAVYTPLLYSQEGDTVVLPQIIVNGRRQQIKWERSHRSATPRPVDGSAIVVRRDEGKPQTVAYSASCPYADWMQLSSVSIAEDLCGCGNLLAQDTRMIAEIDDRPLPEPLVSFIVPAVEAEKHREYSGRAFLDFPVNKTDIRPDYRNNRRELSQILATIDVVRTDPNASITAISIHGYASPEGSYSNNDRLASGRAAALRDYVGSLYSFPSSIFTVQSTPEDWEGFRKFATDSVGLPDRSAILAIIDSDLEPDRKDREIKTKFSATYKYILENWYPALRHSDYTVSYTVRPFTVEEAREIIKTKPQQLSLNEMFGVAATYEPGSQAYNEVMETAVRMYPADPVANLNAASASLLSGNLASASRYLERAGDSPEAIHLRGILAYRQGDREKAREFISRAADAGLEEAKTNLKQLRLSDE